MTYAEYRTKVTELNLKYQDALLIEDLVEAEIISDKIDELIKDFYEN